MPVSGSILAESFWVAMVYEVKGGEGKREEEGRARKKNDARKTRVQHDRVFFVPAAPACEYGKLVWGDPGARTLRKLPRPCALPSYRHTPVPTVYTQPRTCLHAGARAMARLGTAQEDHDNGIR